MSSKALTQQHALTKDGWALLTLPQPEDPHGERKGSRGASHPSLHVLTSQRLGSLSADNTPVVRSKPRNSSAWTLGPAPGHVADSAGAVEREASATRTVQASRRPPPMRSPPPGERSSVPQREVSHVKSLPRNFATCTLPDAQPERRGSGDLSMSLRPASQTSPQTLLCAGGGQHGLASEKAHHTPSRSQQKHHHQHSSHRHSYSAPHASASTPPQAFLALQRRRLANACGHSATGAGCEAASMAAATAVASRDPVAALRGDDQCSPDSSRFEERRSKSSWELHRGKSSHLKPSKRSGWCEESQGPTPQTSSRALSVVSTAASSQDEAAGLNSPTSSTAHPHGRPARSLWLGDFGDLPGTDRDSAVVPHVAVASPKAGGCGQAVPHAATASPQPSGRSAAAPHLPVASPEASGRSSVVPHVAVPSPKASPKASSRCPALPAEEEGQREAHVKAERSRRPPSSHKNSGWVSGVPLLRTPVAVAAAAAQEAVAEAAVAPSRRPRTPLKSSGQPAPCPEKSSPSRSPSKSSSGHHSPDKRPVSAAGLVGRRFEAATALPPDAPLPPPRTSSSKNERAAIRHLDEGGKIYDFYTWDKVLQEEGNGGKVVICRSKAPGADPGTEYVLKIRNRAELRRIGLENQFCRVMERMLNLPPHPGVVKVLEVWKDETFYYVVMEKANAGSLFGCLISDFRDGCMPAGAVRKVMRDILEALGHVHKHGMLHRDIKPDNLVMHRHSDGSSGACGSKRVMLIDFDHADPEWKPGGVPQESDEVFGTMRFNAPEAMLGTFQPQGDLYSVGVILYLLMTGRFPFSDEVFAETPKAHQQHWSRRRLAAVYGRMREARVDFDCSPWPEQPACRDICKRLIAFEASKRPHSTGEALRHPWFREEEPHAGPPLQ